MQRALVHLLTTLAFVASLFAMPALAPAKKGGAALDAARLALTIFAKPSLRKAERTRAADAMTPCVFAIAVPSHVVERVAPSAPVTWTRPAPDRSELMVFLN